MSISELPVIGRPQLHDPVFQAALQAEIARMNLENIKNISALTERHSQALARENKAITLQSMLGLLDSRFGYAH